MARSRGIALFCMFVAMTAIQVTPGFGSRPQSAKDPAREHRTFLQWCLASDLSQQEAKTVEILKKIVKATDDCYLADQKLAARTELLLDLKYESVDLGPVASLSNLRVLAILGGYIESLSPLSLLVNLEELSIASTPIVDVSPLGALTKLTKLVLSSTYVEDIRPLAKLKALQTLGFWFTGSLHDITPLQELTHLTIVDLTRTGVSNVQALRSSRDLAYLYLEATPLSDVSYFDGFKNLVLLDLRNSKVSQDDMAQLSSRLPKCTIKW